MRRLATYTILSIAILLFAIPTYTPLASYSGYPYFYIGSIVTDKTVTIEAHNFPANDTFTVTMGAYGSLGVGGIVVGATNSGSGGSFVATYSIPSQLAGYDRIAIRLESPSTGYYAYNWFNNDTSLSGPGPQPGYSGYPYFFIASVVKDQTVKIEAYNFPLNDTFTVRMGDYGTLGIGGIVVADTETGSEGNFTVTYDIPAQLVGSYRIAIRLDSVASGYYAYNWFYNNTATVPVEPAPAPVPDPPTPPSPPQSPPYSGYPYFLIASVKRDSSVTISAYNFPPEDEFVVTMGAYGSLGIGGFVVEMTDTGDGDAFSKTYTIPTDLAGAYRIAIRLQSPSTNYYAYNWFYNNSTP